MPSDVKEEKPKYSQRIVQRCIRFAETFVIGNDPVAAHLAAYPSTRNWTAEAQRVGAYKLLNHPRTIQELDTIRALDRSKIMGKRDRILRKLENIMDGVEKAKQRDKEGGIVEVTPSHNAMLAAAKQLNSMLAEAEHSERLSQAVKTVTAAHPDGQIPEEDAKEIGQLVIAQAIAAAKEREAAT